MRRAIAEARKAEKIDEVPVGAVIVYQEKIIARAYNKRVSSQLTASHAEMLAIQKANKVLNSWRLDDCDLYVTLEPCPMCAGAIHQSRIGRVFYGAPDPKAGFMGSKANIFEVKGLNHYPEITGGILEEECSMLLKDFFKKIRNKTAVSE